MTKGGEKLKKIYMIVTDDEYELPLAVADSLQEMAEITEKSYWTLAQNFSKKKKGYIKIVLDEEGEKNED